MSNHERRLGNLEKVWPKPALPATPSPPPDLSRLSDEDRATYEEIAAVMEAMDVGPVPLSPERDFAARLEQLTDDQLGRLKTLSEKIVALQQEGTTA